MSIDEEIKSTFKDERHRVGVNLIYTSNQMLGMQAVMLREHGLTVPQYNVLRILRGQYPSPIKVNDIIARMLDKMSNASRLVDKLVQKDMAVRCESTSDRRAVDVSISQVGLDVLAALDPLQEEFMQSFGGALTYDEARTLSNLLDKMRSSLQP